MSSSRRKTAPFELGKELEDPAQLRALLAETQQDRLALKNRVEELERQLAALAEQQDSFVADLIDDHERQLVKVRAEREEPPPVALEPDPARVRTAPAVPGKAATEDRAELDRELDALRRERDRSREVLRRLQAQRDQAQALAERTLSRLAELEADPLRPTPHEPLEVATAKRNPDVRTNPTPKRKRSRGDLPAARRESTASARAELSALDAEPDAPALKTKPDPTQRPLGSYAVGPGSVTPERVPGKPRR